MKKIAASGKYYRCGLFIATLRNLVHLVINFLIDNPDFTSENKFISTRKPNELKHPQAIVKRKQRKGRGREGSSGG